MMTEKAKVVFTDELPDIKSLSDEELISLSATLRRMNCWHSSESILSAVEISFFEAPSVAAKDYRKSPKVSSPYSDSVYEELTRRDLVDLMFENISGNF